MIGSSFFIGAFVGSFILPRLADIVGRKPMFILGIILYVLSNIGTLLSRSLPMLYATIILGGVSETGRYYVAYVYAIEIMPERLQHISGLAIFFFMASIKIIVCLYFWTSEAKDWKVMSYIALGCAIVSFIGTIFFMPESPRFLLKKKKFSECAKILMAIQRTNKGADRTLDLDPINLDREGAETAMNKTEADKES